MTCTGFFSTQPSIPGILLKGPANRIVLEDILHHTRFNKVDDNHCVHGTKERENKDFQAKCLQALRNTIKIAHVHEMRRERLHKPDNPKKPI